jgi:arsenate reductase (glutaredoxin)
MKKARAWLEAHGVAYAFHGYKLRGVERGVLEKWAGAVGWETLLNRAANHSAGGECPPSSLISEI